ncbi:MAG: ABC transporter ATP-binding protein, partial [Natronospirillum sp.]
LLAEPQAVLLDEPFSKLDRALRGQFREWVFATLQARQVPALQVTHDTEDAAGRLYDLELGGLR